jgi:hypothetical protein
MCVVGDTDRIPGGLFAAGGAGRVVWRFTWVLSCGLDRARLGRVAYYEALPPAAGITPPTPLDSCFRRNDEKLPRPASCLGDG